MGKIILERGWEQRVQIDSAGTGDYHVGELADHRSRRAAKRRGIEIVHRARQLARSDYDRFDYLLAMDRSNLAVIHRRAPEGARATIALLRSFDQSAPVDAEVPDPYDGDDEDFEDVLDICERACQGLAAHLAREHLGA